MARPDLGGVGKHLPVFPQVWQHATPLGPIAALWIWAARLSRRVAPNDVQDQGRRIRRFSFRSSGWVTSFLNAPAAKVVALRRIRFGVRRHGMLLGEARIGAATLDIGPRTVGRDRPARRAARKDSSASPLYRGGDVAGDAPRRSGSALTGHLKPRIRPDAGLPVGGGHGSDRMRPCRSPDAADPCRCVVGRPPPLEKGELEGDSRGRRSRSVAPPRPSDDGEIPPRSPLFQRGEACPKTCR